jgi:hypothetical protein
VGVDHLVSRHEEIVHVTDVMPSFSKSPTEDLTIGVSINICFVNIEVLFFVVIVQLFDLEVDFVEEDVPI